MIVYEIGSKRLKSVNNVRSSEFSQNVVTIISQLLKGLFQCENCRKIGQVVAETSEGSMLSPQKIVNVWYLSILPNKGGKRFWGVCDRNGVNDRWWYVWVMGIFSVNVKRKRAVEFWIGGTLEDSCQASNLYHWTSNTHFRTDWKCPRNASWAPPGHQSETSWKWFLGSMGS